MTFDPVQQMKDQEHLRLLKIGYYVYAALTAFGALAMIVQVVLGLLFMAGAIGDDGGAPRIVGGVLLVVGLIVMMLIALLAWLFYLTGQKIAERRGRTFCLVMAVIACLNIPIGTILGIFTFIVLSRPSVTALFEGTPPLPPAANHAMQ